jgi:N-acetyl-gamma-glutamylphosphate reductase
MSRNPVELSPEKLNHSNMLEINVFSNKEETQCLLTATFDNLGKGASRAAGTINGANVGFVIG